MTNPINLGEFNSYSPGAYIIESADGFTSSEIPTHAVIYMLGTASQGTYEPKRVYSVYDFVSIFGAGSPCEPYVEFLFNNDRAASLVFVRVNAVDDAAPTASEYVATAQEKLHGDLTQGLLIAPQAYQYLTVADDRLAVFEGLKGVAEDTDMQWLHMADCHSDQTTVEAIETEFALYSSASGHAAVFAPYLIDYRNREIPASVFAVAVASRTYRERGFQNPPAGTRYAAQGLKGLKRNFTRRDQDTLNAKNINLIRNLRSAGNVVWGARTKTSNPAFRFINQRVIFNVMNRTLRNLFDTYIFSVIDGKLSVITRIKESVNTILYRFWSAGALFGRTPNEAYEVVVNQNTNQLSILEAGRLRVDIYAIPSPTLEQLIGRLVRVPIGYFTANVGGAQTNIASDAAIDSGNGSGT